MLTCRCRCEWSGSQRPDLRVEVELLGLLLAVGAALPGEHRPVVAGRPRRRPGHAEARVPVVQQGAGQDRPLEVEEREDEHLVPEDVAPVGLPVPAARRDTGVEVDGVGRHGLQQVEDVQVQDGLGPLVGAVQLDVEPVPEAVPGALVAGQQPGEARRRRDRSAGRRRGSRRSPGRGRCRGRRSSRRVAGRPCSSSTASSWATNPGSSTSRRSAWAIWPSRSSLVRAARATRTWDWVVSTCRSTVSCVDLGLAQHTVRWRPFRSR